MLLILVKSGKLIRGKEKVVDKVFRYWEYFPYENNDQVSSACASLFYPQR